MSIDVVQVIYLDPVLLVIAISVILVCATGIAVLMCKGGEKPCRKN